MADKIVKAFEALRSHYLQESTAQQPTVEAESPASGKVKKDVSLMPQERINYCNAIADFLPMQTVKNINEFPRLLTLAMELLLVCCDDKEADVRLVAGECINKIMKAFLDSNFGRIQVELYKEIKKNGPSRSLRAALQRFGETCHLIRVHKCRPYIANLLPCIVKIVKREDDSVQEVLGTMMLKLCPVLGMFMNEHDIKILLKSFLPNLASASATTRRTAASTLNTLCKHSRKPGHFYSWLVNMLLASITPLTNELPAHTILGALLCFRNIVPNLGECCVEMQGMKDSFGSRAKKNEAATVKDLVLEKKQFHQIYEVTMFCTKHTDHNIVTAALENLYQILSSKAKPMLEILLSSNGIAPTITGNAQSLAVDSGISDDSMSMGSVSLTDKLKLDELSISTSDSGLGELGQSMESTLFSAIQVESDCKDDLDLSSIGESDDVVNESDLFEDGDVERPLPLSIPASFTDGEIQDNSARETRLGTNISDIPDHDSLASFEEHRRDETTSLDSSTIIERQFNFDAVTCTGVPLLHCVRLMCSFLLNGEPGNVLSDSKTRVSIKSLALNCISLALNLYPEAIYPKVMPTNFTDSSDSEGSSQLIRDIMLLKTHDDPQIRGAISTIIGQFLSAGMHISVGDFDQWNVRMSEKYSTECVDLLEYIKVLANMLSDESAIVIKQSCLAVKSCINILCHSTYSLYGYELIWNLLFLRDMSYWLVKVEVMEVFQMLDYRLMSILELIWIKEKKVSNVNYKYRNLQQQVIRNIVMVMLGDEDARVRYSAANCCVNIIRNLYCVTAQDGNVSSSHKSLYCGNMSYMIPPEEWRKCKVENKANVEKNLSFVIRKVTEQLRVAGTKYLTHGCTQCLYLLSETFSVINYPLSWELLPVTLLNPSAVKSPLVSQSVNTFVPVASGPQSMIKSTSSYGLQYIIFDLISATWMTLDLQAHTEALKLGIHLLCGTSYYYLQKKGAQSGGTDGCGGWLTSEDPQLKTHADKMFVHCMRLMNILTHVVEQTNPAVTAPKQSNSTPVKDKEKGSGASGRDSPAPTTPQTSVPSAVPQNPDSPKKFSLAKALQKKQEPPSDENKNTSGNVPSETKQSTPPPSGQSSERVGLFQHDSHLLKLHEVLKGSFKNYQVSSVHRLQDKFCSFMRGVLESFGLLVELATFTELGSHAEEILEYLKATAGLEEEASLLAVQQLLKGLFGTNSASQPDTYELATSTTHLVETMGDPTFYQDTNHPINHYSDIYSNYMGLYGEGFLKSYNDFCLSLKLVPQVEVSVEKGSLSILKFFKKNMLSNRPTAKVSKDRVSSIQSYIRLFEPLVIHALKSYTTTSSIRLQCQAIHLLNQLIRLRVNYSLLDSDQVFIGFVLKQFEFIDNGQVSQPQLFIPTIFQFLVLLSYECFQHKFAAAKAIIGMPRIIQLCNDVMACGLPPVSYAIPALKPIVQDLFASQSQARPDSSKDLDTQREVVVSMLLRVIQYPEVLSLLTHVLNGSKSDDDKWKRLSRQVVDVFLPSLSKLDVNLTSVNSLLLLFNLLDSVAPLALRPADIILKALFDSNLPENEADVIRFMSMVIALMRTLIMQNSEDIIFSRMQQLDVSYIRTCFSTNNEKFHLVSTKSESNAADYLSSFLFFVLRVSVDKLLEKSRDLTADRTQLCMLSEIIKMYFELVVYLSKCGLFKKLTSSLVSLLFSPNQTVTKRHSVTSSDSTSVPTETDSAGNITLLTEMTNKLFMLKSVEPLMSLKWIYVVRSLGISDTEFWREFHHIWTNGNKAGSMINDLWKDELIQHGSLMLYCDITLSRLKEQKDVDHSIIGQFLKGNMRDVLYLMTELPVKELVSRILQQAELSAYFIESLSELVTNDFNLVKPTMLKFILGLLESIDLTHSSGVVHLLLKILPKVTVYGLSRKAETLACRRLEIEYITSLEPGGNELPNSELTSFGLHKLHSKRYPRFCALIQRITKSNASKQLEQQSPTVSHPLASPQLDVEKYKINKEWMYNFVENSCMLKNETLHKSSIYLLRSIELNQIEKVMLSPEFDVTLLELCIDAAFSSEQYLRLHYRLTTSNQLSLRLEHESMYDAVGTTEEENKDKLLDLSKGLVLKHVADILDKFRDEETYNSKVYFAFNQKEIDQLGGEGDSIRHYLIFIRCLIKLLGQTSSFNQTWYMSANEANRIVEYIFLLPLLCVYELNNKSNASIMLIQLCFQSLSLILHCEDFSVVLSNETYACVLVHTVSCIHQIVAQLTMQPAGETGELERHSIYNSPASDDNPTGHVANRFQTGCLKVSSFFQSLRSIFEHGNSDTTLPSLLVRPLRQVITGLARLTIVNSYTRVPPIVWHFGWTPESEGPFLTELPPLPVDILKEKDVLKEFISRVNHVGWISRMQFEETWAALLGVLSSIPILDDISTDEEIELAQSSSLVIHCITSLLLDTMLSPSPGNFAISQFSVVHRQRDYPFLGSKAGKKLVAVRNEIEIRFCDFFLSKEQKKYKFVHPVVPSLLSAKLRKQYLQYGCMMRRRLFISNLELPLDHQTFNLGQVSAAAIRTRLVTTDTQENTDSDDSDSLIIALKDQSPFTTQPADAYRKLEELDIRSCLQFLLELFEQWLSPFANPRTPLMLKMEAIKSLCVLSDLFLELNHYEWILGILLDFSQNHPGEDEITMQYLVPTMCKALAVLKLEGATAERICKQVESYLKSPHLPLQISSLVGSLYILETLVNPTVAILAPILTEYITKKLNSPIDPSNIISHRYSVVLWSVAFYLIENCSSEIQDAQFPVLVLENAIQELNKATNESSPSLMFIIFQGLERLVVSFSLTRPECEEVAKVAANWVYHGSTRMVLSALGLLCTCMYTGKESDHASGLAGNDIVIDAPMTESRLVMMERMNILLSRIRKGQLSEAVLLATILPRILLDFLPVQEVMNKLIAEFLSSQQPRPELIAKIFNKVSDLLYKENEDALICEWVFLCVASFVQRTPLCMAIWSLTCFFISASTNPWLKSTFPFIVERKGKLDNKDKEIFSIAALDFYLNPNLTDAQRDQFLQTFRSKTETLPSSPYENLINCCMQARSKLK